MKPHDEIQMHDVRRLYARLGWTARDLAARLLGEDPIEAERIARKAFRTLLGHSTLNLACEDWIHAVVEEEVVGLCLIHTGNEAVADWEDYQITHPDPKPEKPSVTTARRVATIRPHAPSLAAAHAAPTRRARQERLEARRTEGPVSSRPEVVEEASRR